jgi:hypothetical protein
MALSDEQMSSVLAAMSDGLSLSKACKKLKLNRRAVFKRLHEDSTWREAYRLAQDTRAHLIGDQILEELAATPIFEDKDGVRRVDPGAVQLMRVRSDHKRWLLARMSPRAFGDRVEVTGADGQPLIPSLRNSSLSQRVEAARLVAFFLRSVVEDQAGQPQPPLALPAPCVSENDRPPEYHWPHGQGPIQ